MTSPYYGVGVAEDPREGCIVLAAFQPSPETFQTQLQSVAEQTVRAWRCIIVADGNHLEVDELVHAAVPGDERFQVVGHHDRVGFYQNFERGLEAVNPKSKWVALCDQDDRWHPRKLERLLPLLDHATLAQGQAEVWTDGVCVGLTDRRRVTLDGLMINNQISGSLSVFRTSLLDLAIPFPSASPSSFHDHWLGLCARTTGSIAYLHEPVQAYMQHESNVIGEYGQGSTLDRVKRLITDNPASWRTVLVEHRLGWRREMAATLLERLEATHPLMPTLEMWTNGRWRLLAGIAHAVVTRQAPPARSAALALGAVLAPRQRRT